MPLLFTKITWSIWFSTNPTMIHEQDEATSAEAMKSTITQSLQQLEEGQADTGDEIDRVKEARSLIRISLTHF